jgi:hypothetical protein
VIRGQGVRGQEDRKGDRMTGGLEYRRAGRRIQLEKMTGE